MSVLLVIVGLLILSGSVLCLFYNPQYTVIGCLLLITVDFCFKDYIEQNTYQAVFKLLILCASMILLMKSRKGLNRGIIIICSVLFLISLFLLRKYSLPDFGFSDVLTSFLTTVTGFILMYVPWNPDIRTVGLKAFAWSPIASALFGIFVNGEFFDSEKKLQGMDSAASLVIVAALGVLCCYLLAAVYKQSNYFFVGVADFIICGLCNMRGGLLFLFFILLGISIPYIKRIPKKLVNKLLLLTPLIAIAVLIIGRRIVEKTFDMTYSVMTGGNNTINTSNRLWAWGEILKATKKHRLFGWGIGYTKKIDGVWLNYGYRAVHNEYIRWLVETGYVGLFGIIICFIMIYLFIRKHNLGINRWLVTFLFVGFAIFSYTDNTMYGTAGWMSFSFVISLLGANIGRGGREIRTNDKKIIMRKRGSKRE